MFFAQAERLGDKPFLWSKRGGHWQSLSWRQVADQVSRLARGLADIGIGPGDRVVLVAESRPEWLIADVAIMAAGGISVPAYTTNTVGDHLHILNNASAKAVIVSTAALADRVVAAALQAAHEPIIVSVEDPDLQQNPGLQMYRWDELLERGGALPEDTMRLRIAGQQRHDTACLIYTSGTGGAPKGVMLSHGAILCNCHGADRLLAELKVGEDEVFLSFLPLSHSYEHTAGQFFPIGMGAQIYYAEGVDALSSNMVEAHPTIMTAVPRLYELMRARIVKGVERTGGRKAKLFFDAVRLGTKRYQDPRSLTLTERLYDKLLDVLVRRKVAERFGGRLKAFVSGGAPLNPEVGTFFLALGIRIMQGYGQTESAPVISCNPPRKIKIDTVGPALEGVEVRIADDGEICIRGELVMQGYWADPEATAYALQEGWLHTGDIGHLDADGYIRITDRKKDIIVNSGGDNISPQRVEGFLTLEPEIAQAMVHGDKRPHVVALIVPDADFATAWARKHDKDEDDLERVIADPEFRRVIGAAVDRVNRQMSAIEKVRRFILTAEPFSVANGMMTPTMKIRRHVIRQTHGAALEALYHEDKRG
jgi:long-chain acyl-CoA synthetase